MNTFKLPDHIIRKPPTVILGQPGSGKTRELIHQVQEYLEYFRSTAGDDFHDDFSFVSYTNPGVNAGLERLNLPKGSEAEFFSGTLHALCRRHGNLEGFNFVPGINTTQLFDKYNILTEDILSVLRDYEGSGEWVPGDEANLESLRSEYDRQRHQNIEMSEDHPLLVALRKAKLADFTESMVLTLERGWRIGAHEVDYLPINMLFIDEAQDLTPLMWELVFRRFRPSTCLCIAGDPRQSLYRHQGVDPAIFRSFIELSLSANKLIHQPVSHRVPEKVYHFANHIAKGFNDSDFWESAGIKPRTVQKGGVLGHIISGNYLNAFFSGLGHVFDDIVKDCNFSKTESRMPELADIAIAYLTPVNKKMRPIMKQLAKIGICPVVPSSKGKNPFRWMWSQRYVGLYLKNLGRPIEQILIPQEKKAYEYVDKEKKSKIHGTEFKIFLEVLSKAEDSGLALKRAYSFLTAVLLSTVHKSKGLEFPWVILNWNRGLPGEDWEHLSTFYVGVTRCLEGLVVHKDSSMRSPKISLEGWIREELRSFEDEKSYEAELRGTFRSLSTSLKRIASDKLKEGS